MVLVDPGGRLGAESASRDRTIRAQSLRANLSSARQFLASWRPKQFAVRRLPRVRLAAPAYFPTSFFAAATSLSTVIPNSS